LYLVAKTAHILSVFCLISSFWTNLWIWNSLRSARGDDVQRVLARWRALDGPLGSSSLLLVWTFGVWMLLEAGWFRFHWMQLKLVAVLLLSGLHGVVTGRVRRMAEDPSYVPGAPGVLLFTTVALVVSVVALVVSKAV
jgi:protoporphyrinogen IX oxidase